MLMTNLNELTTNIKQWAVVRGLDEKGIICSGVEGFPNHVVTSDGRVFVMEYVDERGRTRKERELKPNINSDGYKCVWLSHKGESVVVKIHRLVAQSFIPNPQNKETVNHIDGDKQNNNVDNLEWADRSEQLYHAYEMGLKKYSQNAKTSTIKKIGKPVRCFDKKSGETTYHVTARECSEFVGKSPRWCDKIIGTQNGETKDYLLEYVTSEDLEKNGITWSLTSLVELIKFWSIERELHKANPDKQFLKIAEEIGEIAGAKAKSDIEGMKLEIGDAIVTLIIFSQQQNIDFRKCVEAAYNKISNRTGTLKNGVYVKSEDL